MFERFQAGVDGVTGNAVANILPALNSTKRATIKIGSMVSCSATSARTLISESAVSSLRNLHAAERGAGGNAADHRRGMISQRIERVLRFRSQGWCLDQCFGYELRYPSAGVCQATSQTGNRERTAASGGNDGRQSGARVRPRVRLGGLAKAGVL